MFRKYSQFYKPENTEQKLTDLVDITDWAIGGSFAYYPDGSRAKFEVFCPSNIDYSFLIPNHRYLFKKTFERKSGIIFYEQFWTEIIAYKLGRILNIEVPPAFIACYTDPVRKTLEYASLIEWYYNYPGAVECRIDRGGDFMSRALPAYDREKGKQHNFQTILQIFNDWLHIANWKQKWAEILLFDTIIGNTDRHQENWEVYAHFDKNGDLIEALSPAFDNGTSMGYEILSKDLQQKLSILESYVSKGTHHMKWELADTKNAGHFELLEKLVCKFPETESVIRSKINVDISALASVVSQLTQFTLQDQRYALSKERADFIIELIKFRFNKIKEIFNS